MPSAVAVQHLVIDMIAPYPQNPRHITDTEMAKLQQSLIEDAAYFETRPIICSDRTGSLVIIAGEKRWLAARALGWREVPVAVLSGLTESDERRILVKDNGSFGWWDWDEFARFGFSDLPVADWGVLVPFETHNVLEDNPDYALNEPQRHLDAKEKVYRVKCPNCGFNFTPAIVEDPDAGDETPDAVAE